MKKIIIAIDGHSSCGKSTLAQDLAKKLHYIYVDTGAMYRAVTLYFIQNNIDINKVAEVEAALHKISIIFKNINGKNHTFLNGIDVEEQIRSMEISQFVSEVSAISIVRRFLVKQQQALGESKGLVMDGRDIGSVVFPEAELKIFLTASPEVRAKRRMLDYQERNIKITEDEILQNLAHRDLIDSTRADSPLIQTEDAFLLDNSALTKAEQLDLIIQLINKKN